MLGGRERKTRDGVPISIRIVDPQEAGAAGVDEVEVVYLMNGSNSFKDWLDMVQQSGSVSVQPICPQSLVGLDELQKRALEFSLLFQLHL